MKKLASLLVAASAALACSQSFALAPTVTPELTVTLSGATAQDVGLLKLIENLCDAGTIDYFKENGTAKIENYNAYFCTIPLTKLTMPIGVVAVGSLAARDANADSKLDVLVYKRGAGGSGEGPIGVCTDNLALTSQVLVDATCTDSETAASPLQVAGDKHWRCPSRAPRQSDGGLTDLEYQKLNSACAGKAVVAQPIWGTIFNTPVSLNFRNALQCAQGLTVGAEDEANMPNLPKSVIASAFNGGLASWDRLQAKDAAGNYTTLALAVASKVAAGQCPGYDTALFPIPSTLAGATQTRVRACRRVVSSGTNTQFRVKMLNALCTTEAQDQLLDNTGTSDAVTNTNANWQAVGGNNTIPAIIETSGSGNMASCLSAFADSTTPANQRWAIGIQSLENNVGRADRYRFIKIDGAAPTVKNVLEHKYADWVESQWIWLNPAGRTQAQRDAVDFQEILQKGTGENAAVTTLVNSTFIHSFGASALVSLNTIPGNVPSLPAINVDGTVANTVATSTHAFNNALSSCRTPQVRVNTAF
ncbi:MAG: hypothetical protein V4732_00035 [Pseudomonadota bacterium]